MFVEIAPAQLVFALTNDAASMRLVHVAVASAMPPARTPVKEPLRVKQRLVPTANRAKLAPAAPSRPGIRVQGPPMLRPSEIDAKLRASAHSRTPSSETSNAPGPVAPAAGTSRRLGEPGMVHRGTVPRAAQSLPSNPSASGTGINPWWRYQQQNLPGGDHAMINIGTGNLLLQHDDMAVPHKGIAMTFRRTYNSQALAAQPSPYGTWQSLYGTGWTNTFDAHLLDGGPGHKSVYDIDGTRYDYGPNPNGSGYVSLMPGNHATLVFDGSCGYLWTKKSGTTYYFWRSAPSTTDCPSLSPIGGYAGRLYQIIGRNRNTVLTFQYLWDNGDASATGKINTINVTTESGMTTSLTFADVNGRRLLQTLTYPDVATNVQYAYDANGNLAAVSHPPNNAAGVRPQTLYGYQSIGSDSILEYEASPRWCGGPSGCGYDGSWTYFGFSGTSAATSTFTVTAYAVTVNPTIQDGTNTPLYSGYHPDALNESTMRADYYTTGVTTPTFRDTDGRMTNWVVDGTGRPLQTQECTASTNQGQQCTGTWLVTNEAWDANDNLVSEVDPRGYETDYAYDAMGNAVAVAQPQMTTTEGTFRPTSLYDYDAYNNVTAYCDPSETHAAGADWTSSPAASDTLCSSHGVAHTSMSFSYPGNEPYGELATITSPMGYSRHIAYDVTKQGTGGTDFGLPTSVQGDPITQTAGQNVPAQVTPLQSYQYDAIGHVVCYSDGGGTSVFQYDALGRATAHGDPDDGSLPGCGKASSSYTTASYIAYFPDGSLKYSETPIQHAADVASGSTSAAVSYTYDLDGNAITETHHHGCATTAGCTAGVTTKWYDGADRVVEVMQPYDASVDYHSYKWYTRYLYDISYGGTQRLTVPQSSTGSAASTASFRAYGNLYDTQSYVDLGFSTDDSAPRWVDHLGTAYDALDRKTASYDVAIGIVPLHSYLYDQTATSMGFLSSETASTGETIVHNYDAGGNKASTSFTYAGTPPSGASPSRSYAYDADARVASVTSSLGTQTFTYDAAGRVLTTTEPAGQGGNTISYGYAANGWRTSLTVAGALNRQLFSYSYRGDGLLAQQQINNNGWQSFTWSYTPAGRVLQRSDPATGRPVNTISTVRGGYAQTFGPLLYTYDALGNESAVTYSDGYAVRSISSDLEGNQSAEGDSSTYNASSGTYVGSHVSAPRHFSLRDEVAVEGPDVTNINCCTTLTEYANGIQIAGDSGFAGPPVRGGGGGFPLAQIHFTAPNSPLNPLDGFELSSSGSYANGNNGTNYSKTMVYDAAGRFISSDDQECTPDFQAYVANGTETKTQYTYDAEGHTVAEFIGGLQVSTSNDISCTFGALGYTWNYATSWATGGHPFKLDVTPSAPYSHPFSEYLHWDGDTLLFTSSSPSGGVDDIKIGAFAEMTASDGNIAAYDRNAAGEIVDAHTTSWSTPNIPYNDVFADSSHVVLAECNAFGAGQPCIVITEPKPGSLSGYAGFSIQGVRGVDSSLGHWTTPDALSSAAADPASQLPYMYERNNPYRYHDPSGFAAEDCRARDAKPCSPAAPNATPTMSPKEASELLKKFNLSPGMDGRDFLPTLLGLLGFIAPETRAVDIFDAAGMLTVKAVRGSKMIIPAEKLHNASLPAGVAKYTTQTFVENGQRWQAHFYMDPTTRKVFYNLDYKVKPVGKTTPW